MNFAIAVDDPNPHLRIFRFGVEVDGGETERFGIIDWSLLFQGVLIGASVLAGLRGCRGRKGEILSSWRDWPSKQAGVKAVSHESTEPPCNGGRSVEKSGVLDTRELQLSLKTVN